MRKRIVTGALLLCCAVLLTGCMTSPPEALLREGAEDQPLISASIGDLTPELVNARIHFGDEDVPMSHFSVLYDSGVTVRGIAKGVTAEWLYEALTQIRQ